MTQRVGAILVAAGASRRMGFDKLWSPLGERLVLDYALGTLAESPSIQQIVLVLAVDRLSAGRRLALATGPTASVCCGGSERRDSVAAGLRALQPCEWVLVHDAARPFVSEEIIQATLRAAQPTGTAVAAVPATDTIKRAMEDGTVCETLDRSGLWCVQTPQVFRFEILQRALNCPDHDVTDEATLVERLGVKVVVAVGAETNFKITTPVDLELAEAWVSRGSHRPIEGRRAVH